MKKIKQVRENLMLTEEERLCLGVEDSFYVSIQRLKEWATSIRSKKVSLTFVRKINLWF